MAVASTAGERAAFDDAYARFAKQVYWVAYRELGRAADAEDVTQDAFALLWTKRRGLDLVAASPQAWLIVTARNLCRNRKRLSSRRDVALDALPEVAGGTGPEAESERAAIGRALEAAIEAMPAADRAIVELCLIDGLSYKEAAARVQSTHAAVRNRLSRGRHQLQESLTRDGWAPEHTEGVRGVREGGSHVADAAPEGA